VITGYVGSLRASSAQPPVIVFAPNRTWRAFDGCNWSSGTYQATARGEFRATGTGESTLVSCGNVPNERVLAAAARYRVIGQTLLLASPTGTQLARYHRAG
jgi:META domain